jgi:hypothetical protein
VNRSSRFVLVAALAAGASTVAIAALRAGSEPSQGQPQGLAVSEHKLLEKYVGAWDAEVALPAAPGQPPVKSPAKSIARLIGGIWLLTDFESSMMGAPFNGHEVLGYDTKSKHYVATWVDSMSTGFSIGELDFDAKSKTLAGNVNGRDETETPITWRQADVWKDDDSREWTMYRKGPDGKEIVALQITYKRHK